MDGIFMAVVLGLALLKGGFNSSRSLLFAEEVSSQVMCGLFTAQALALQPLRFVLLCLCLCNFQRVLVMRGGPPLPRLKFMGAIVLLNLNCWFRFVMCYFMWNFAHEPAERPAEGEFGCLVLSLVCGALGKALEAHLIRKAETRTLPLNSDSGLLEAGAQDNSSIQPGSDYV